MAGNQRNGRHARVRKLSARIALVCVAFLILPLLFEGILRILPDRTPIQLRDGIYVTRIPLVSSLAHDRPASRGPEIPLPRQKAPGELRIFVYGESSVAGAPFGPEASGSVMLYDLLAPVLTDRKLTVVNMGVSASNLLDTLYYLIASARFAPDIVIFYQGNNEEYVAAGERCVPVAHPVAYSLWRSAVRSSRLLWTLRVFGTRLSRGATAFGKGDGRLMDPPPPDCAWEAAFATWTDIVLDEAQRMGTRPLVLTPVRSPIAMVEFDGLFDAEGRGFNGRLDQFPDDYRAAVRCILDTTCDLFEPLERLASREIRHPRQVGALFGGLGHFDGDTFIPAREHTTFLEHYHWFHDTTRALWKAAADHHGARYADFSSAMEDFSGGLLLPPNLVDEVHLSIEGSWRWGAYCAREVMAILGREVAMIPDPWAVAPDLSAYRTRANEPRALADHFVRFFESRGMALIASLHAREMLSRYDGPQAQAIRDLMLRDLDGPADGNNTSSLDADLARIKSDMNL